jgi:hypothetical protein
MPGMTRRDFVALLGSGAVAWPLATHGQQAGKVIRIGFIGASLNSSAASQMRTAGAH